MSGDHKSPAERPVRLSMNIAGDVADVIRTMQVVEGLTATDAVQQLLSAGYFCYSQIRSGRLVATVDPDGEDGQVVEMFTEEQMRELRAWRASNDGTQP